MANNIYQITDASPTGPTVTVTDDGTGLDWLVLTGVYEQASNITLAWTADAVHATSASGTYWVKSGTSFNAGRLVVNGAIENVRGSNSADYIIGNELNNILYGDQAATGPGGSDTISGGDGNDTIYGGAGGDSLGGAGGQDKLFGGAGADTLSGGLDADTIEGGAGADVLSGGADAGDTVSYASSAAGVKVDITFGSATIGQGGDAQGDSITGFGNVIGSAFNDRIVDTVKGTIAFGYNANRFDGGDGQDWIAGGGGDDTLLGGIGSDTLQGELGNDVLFGGDGYDYLAGGDEQDEIHGGNDGDRIYGGAGADTIFGDAGNDLIFANQGNDRVFAGSGSDTLVGQGGFDRLSGGTGADRFLYMDFTDAVARVSGVGEVITDFSSAEGDKIEFQLPFGVDQLVFKPTGTTLGQSEISYRAVTVNGVASVEVIANIDADPQLEFSITLLGVTSLSAADFIL